ncbi:MAG TPA: S28 family serine protease [Kofleriaceae bacterium]
MRNLCVLGLVLATGCGLFDDGDDANNNDGGHGDDGGGDDGGGGDILSRLNALPGVTATEKTPSQAPAGYRYFQLEFTQDINHLEPTDGTFTQEVSLIHKDTTSPMMAVTTGYDDYIRDAAAEPTLLLGANQISIEHRYFGTSYPAHPDWQFCTVKQMADDEHLIISELQTIYKGKWVTTGASKGGMTAVFEHRFYPDDAAGTLAYVAPLSNNIPDVRYAALYTHADDGTSCRAHVRAFATDLLHNRRAALVTRATTQASEDGYQYTRIAIAPAVESAVRDLEWTFWQYYGEQFCSMVPTDPTTLSDDDAFALLDSVSPISFSADDSTEEFQSYFMQAYEELGSPGLVDVRGDYSPQYLDQYVQYVGSDYSGTFPVGVSSPEFDPTVMADIDSYVSSSSSSHYIFIYGEYDPWSLGEFHLGSSTDSMLATVPMGTHGSGLTEIGSSDQTQAFGKLATWTGVTPDPSQLSRAVVPPRLLGDPRDPRVMHAIKARRAAGGW